MEGKADGLREETEALKASEKSKKIANLRQLLPPFDEKASQASEIYSLSTLIPKSILPELKTKDFLKRAADKNLSKLLQQIIDSLEIDLSEVEDELVKGWNYLDLLLTVYPMKRISKSLNDISTQKGISYNVFNAIVNSFLEKQSKETVEYVKTNKSNLKFVSHITVLFLLLNKLKFPILPLHSALAVPEQECIH